MSNLPYLDFHETAGKITEYSLHGLSKVDVRVIINLLTAKAADIKSQTKGSHSDSKYRHSLRIMAWKFALQMKDAEAARLNALQTEKQNP